MHHRADSRPHAFTHYKKSNTFAHAVSIAGSICVAIADAERISDCGANGWANLRAVSNTNE